MHRLDPRLRHSRNRPYRRPRRTRSAHKGKILTADGQPSASVTVLQFDQNSEVNYDLHVGAIAGLTGKIIAFIAGLGCASLPVTGFLVWYLKRRKPRKPRKPNGPKIA